MMGELKISYLKELECSILSLKEIYELNNCKILITGATGLIGGYIVDMLLHANLFLGLEIEVFALSRSADKLKKRFSYVKSEFLHFIVQDVCMPIDINENIDYIIHAAGDGYPEAFRMRPVETMLPAILGSINTLKVANTNHAKGYVLVSTGEVYGNGKGGVTPFRENDFLMSEGMKTRSCYPVCKQCAEILCASYSYEYNVNIKVARLSHVYGSYTSESDNRASTQFIKSASIGKNIVMHSKGCQVRSYTYIADAATAIIYILVRGKNGEAYNVANSDSIASIAEFAENVAKISGVSVIYNIPTKEQIRETTPISYAILDSSKLQKLGWNSHYSLLEGISSALNNI